MQRSVRVGARYRFEYNPVCNMVWGPFKNPSGSVVRVVNLPGGAKGGCIRNVEGPNGIDFTPTYNLVPLRDRWIVVVRQGLVAAGEEIDYRLPWTLAVQSPSIETARARALRQARRLFPHASLEVVSISRKSEV